MTKTLFKDTLRAVRKNISRYISIMLIVALGTAFFVGMKATAPDMFSTAEQYFIDYNLLDLRVRSNIGLTADDVKAISAVDGIEYVTGQKFTDALVRVNGEIESDIDGTQISTRAYSISPENIANYLNGINDGSYINRIKLLEGKYPTSANECLVDASRLSTPDSYTIGSKITLEGENGDLSSSLNITEFTIVGIIECPYYLSFERGNTNIGSGKVGTYIIIPEEAFTLDYYSEIYITVKGSDAFEPYSDEYFSYIAPVAQNIEAIADKQLKTRASSLKTTLSQEISSGETEIAEKRTSAESSMAELKDTIAQLEELVKNGDQLLNDAQTEYDQKFSNAQSNITSNQSNYTAAMKKYEQMSATKDESEAEYEKNQTEFNKSKASYDKIYAEWQSASSSVNLVSQTIASTQSLITAGEAVLDRISDTQANAYNSEQIQAVITMMQTTYPELYNSVKALTSSGLAGEIATTLEPYITAQKAALAQQEKSIKEKQALLDAIATELKKQEVTLTQATKDLEQAKNDLEQASKDLDDYYNQLISAGYDIKSGQLELEIERIKAESKINELKTQVNQAEGNLETANKKLLEAQDELDSKLASAQSKLDAAKELYSKLGSAYWNVYTRNDTPGYASYGQSVENIKVLSNTFPIFFIIISSLICLTTMTRMIDEDRILLGTYKALGYTSFSIMLKYIIYSLSACIFGTVIGIAAGVFLFPYAINTAYGIMYSLPDLQYHFPWLYAAIGLLISLMCTTLVTVLALKRELKANPAVLMRAKSPKAGKRILLEHIGFIWKHLSFTTKVTMRNLFRNAPRFLMTVVGIAGCSALLLASLGMKNSIDDIVTKQYKNNAVSQYDFQLVFDDAQSTLNHSAEFTEASKDTRIDSLLLTAMKSMTGSSERGDAELDVYLLVPENSQSLSDFVNLHNRKTGEQYLLDDSGAIITEKLAHDTNTAVGEEITFTDSDSNSYKVRVSAIAENYTFHYIYMTPTVYKAVTGDTASFGYALGKLSDSVMSSDATALANTKGLLATDIMKIDGITAIAFTSDTTKTISEITNALSIVIILFFVSALILAFVVLYNLSNINIIERTRELATLKVLGFIDSEVSRYVYRENIVISVFGIAFGMILGVGLHYLLITFTAIDTVMYGQNIEWYSYLIAIAVTVLFIVAVNAIMHRKLKKVDMVLSLKSVE